MKVLADINVSVVVVDILRRSGVAIERVIDSLDPRSSDVEILAAALERGAVLLSHDQDFAELLALSGAIKPSLINVRVTSIDPVFLARCIRRALQEASTELASGAVVTVEDGGIRVRRLPVLGE